MVKSAFAQGSILLLVMIISHHILANEVSTINEGDIYPNTTSPDGLPGTIKPLYVVGLLPYSEPWPSGWAVRHVEEIALRHINDNPNVLPGYELRVVWEDTECRGGVGAHKLITDIFTPPTKVMVIGDSLSNVCVATAEFSHFYNLVQISAEASAPVLSDKSRFPFFFRVNSPETSRNPLLLQLMAAHGWTKVAAITEFFVAFTLTTDHLVGLLEENNVTLLTSEIVQRDAIKPLKALKAVDARIIIGLFWELTARRIFCEAYKMGFYGPHIVWHLPGWFMPQWWATPDPNIDCTVRQMEAVTEGVMYAAFAMTPLTWDTEGVSGYTPREIDNIIFEDDKTRELFAIDVRFNFYDIVWASALALNASIVKLAQIGKELSDFSYSDDAMGRIIKESMQGLVFQGALGIRQFDQFGNPKVNQEIAYQRNGTREPVGLYIFDSEGEAQLQFTNTIRWIGGRVPSDSTYVVDLPLYMNYALFVSLAALAALGILLAAVFLGFNIGFRNKRVIRMSSPMMNNLILLGCMSIFTTVFFYEQDEQLTQEFCMVRVFTLTIGFSLVFGSLFSKTWRVHVIFSSKRSVNIQDRQLFLIVLVIFTVNLFVLVLWMVMDPFQTTFITDTQKVVDSEQDMAIRYRVSVCVSAYSSVFSGALYVIQGVILAFGAFLAWETRKVTIEALNDSQLIGTCIYNVLILSLLGVGLGYVLADQTHLVYALNAAFMVLATLATQCIIFMPKVVSVLQGQADVAPSTLKKEPTVSTTA